MPLMASMQQPSVMRSHAAAIRAQAQMKLLYVDGGALDSQTTETQWVQEYTRSDEMIDMPQYGRATMVPTACPLPVASAEITAPVPPEVLTELKDLRAQLEVLQKALEREQRLSALYCQSIEALDLTIVEMQSRIDISRLDPAHSSQVFLEEEGDQFLPSTQSLMAFIDTEESQMTGQALY
ncbi:hypothetical protein C8Q72DRAFT_883311 [Fomitopsis betulina]|nr:hypothetical protein C8Q72DRAFT_883311 [Fomitopsis betulina]